MNIPLDLNDPDYTSCKNKGKTLLWLQSGGCGGCSLSLLCAEGPDLFTAFDAAGIDVLWHPSLSEQSGDEFLDIVKRIEAGEQQLDFLCLEGALGFFLNCPPVTNWIKSSALLVLSIIS